MLRIWEKNSKGVLLGLQLAKSEAPGIGHDPVKMFAAKEARDALLENK